MSNAHPSVKITDGTHSPVLGNGVVQVTPSLTIFYVLYVPRFPISLLSINQLTKQNNCKIIFFLLIVCFRTCQLGGGLVQDMRKEGCTIWTIE